MQAACPHIQTFWLPQHKNKTATTTSNNQSFHMFIHNEFKPKRRKKKISPVTEKQVIDDKKHVHPAVRSFVRASIPEWKRRVLEDEYWNYYVSESEIRSAMVLTSMVLQAQKDDWTNHGSTDYVFRKCMQIINRSSAEAIATDLDFVQDLTWRMEWWRNVCERLNLPFVPDELPECDNDTEQNCARKCFQTTRNNNDSESDNEGGNESGNESTNESDVFNTLVAPGTPENTPENTLNDTSADVDMYEMADNMVEDILDNLPPSLHLDALESLRDDIQDARTLIDYMIQDAAKKNDTDGQETCDWPTLDPTTWEGFNGKEDVFMNSEYAERTEFTEAESTCAKVYPVSSSQSTTAPFAAVSYTHLTLPTNREV